MRKWRVGNISLGLLLIIFGAGLFLSQWNRWDPVGLIQTWWPLILMVLGLEITLYVFLSGEERPIVRYDLLSIFMIAFVAVGSAGMVVLSSTGLLDEVRVLASGQRITEPLPPVERTVSTDIRRIVLDTGGQNVKVETTAAEQLRLFGTYERYTVDVTDETLPFEPDYVTVHQVDDTLYVEVKPLPDPIGLSDRDHDMKLTVVLPADVRAEIRGGYRPLALYADGLQSDWWVRQEGPVSFYMPERADVRILAYASSRDAFAGDVSWRLSPQLPALSNADDEKRKPGEELYQGEVILGKGTYRLEVFESDRVEVMTYGPPSTP